MILAAGKREPFCVRHYGAFICTDANFVVSQGLDALGEPDCWVQFIQRTSEKDFPAGMLLVSTLPLASKQVRLCIDTTPPNGSKKSVGSLTIVPLLATYINALPFARGSPTKVDFSAHARPT